CLELVEEVAKELGNLDDDGDDDEVCALCYDKILNEFYRLEYCGHAYCKTCILHLFENSSDFPLSCVGCSAPIVLADLYWATKQVQLLEKIVLKKSLDFFIRNKDDISYCPSPDCPMIYRVAKDGKTLFECPMCSNVICTNCGDLYHYGMSCSLYQCSKHDDDYSLKVWMLADEANRKLCPSCSSPIEKNEGCNHMTCWKCRAHMCWLCLQVFPSALLVYNHQAFCPKQKM
ncbi:ATP-dependent RNA helicase DEAH12, chloroplastic-like, partial [Stegodyphus dumicola]|uniref:ATP-dependent RNA helicase DEAH12, chloroplastic-like n=1 Tax=Stegodyphus dumicola TaxID=202533 RepID=UPI0015AF6A23